MHDTGWARSLRVLLDRGALNVLRAIYGFHPWHAAAPLSARPYRHAVATLIAGMTPPPRCVVEVGCGLGAILRLAQAEERVGYDIDPGAVRAARFLHGGAIRFVEGGMEAVAEPQIDLLVMVNWIHDFDPGQLLDWLAPLLPRCSYLLVDAIDRDNPHGYRHAHDFAFLQDRVREVRSSRTENEGRRFILFEVIR